MNFSTRRFLFSKSLLFSVACILSSCDRCSTSKTKTTDAEANKTEATAVDGGSTPATTESAATPEAPANLEITDVKVGKGAEAVDGKKLTVHYTGTLMDGTKFDSSKDRGTPFNFTLGSGMVIAGWDQGIKGMKEGGIRKLVIPAALAYGDRAVGGVIPPNSSLSFEIELLKVE